MCCYVVVCYLCTIIAGDIDFCRSLPPDEVKYEPYVTSASDFYNVNGNAALLSLCVRNNIINTTLSGSNGAISDIASTSSSSIGDMSVPAKGSSSDMRYACWMMPNVIVTMCWCSQ
jgi:hypothetical protein